MEVHLGLSTIYSYWLISHKSPASQAHWDHMLSAYGVTNDQSSNFVRIPSKGSNQVDLSGPISNLHSAIELHQNEERVKRPKPLEQQ